jgi:CheY-like chemotaxis protein
MLGGFQPAAGKRRVQECDKMGSEVLDNGPVSVTNKSVLIVDDDPDARAVLREIITTLGVGTNEAPDGRQALSRIEQEIPALIILDLMMPHMDGFSVINCLQSDPKLRNIPVVVMTAVDTLQTEMIAVLPGVSKVIRKGDFRVADIVAIVKTLSEPDIAH